MKTALKLVLAAFVLCLPSLNSATGQEAIKARLDSIRQHRPTVALVLSGGGAKGAAEIGAMKYIDSLRIPIDLVVGTSIGGLIGGMYATGASWDEMNQVISDAEWDVLLSDQVPQKYIPYEKRRRDAAYTLTLPFQKGFQIKAKGLVNGLNVEMLLSRITAGWHDSLSFAALKVPFVCVATDLAKCKTKVWYDGVLPTAMRTTMSIPAFFAPVKMEDMVLVDGGMRNNFPVDIARDLGADYVIGINLSQGLKDYEDINNIGDMLIQIIDLIGRDEYEKNIPLADVVINPDLKGYHALSFSKAGVADMIGKGYRAAVEVGDTLQALAAKIGAKAPETIDREKPEILAIDEDGKYLDLEAIEKKVYMLYGTGAYETVNYTLEGRQSPYKLNIHTSPATKSSLGIGIRSDNDELASVILNLGYGVNKLTGTSMNLTGKIGVNPYASLEIKHKFPLGVAFGWETFYRYVDRNRFRTFDSDNFSVMYHYLKEELYASTFTWSLMDVRAGARLEYFDLKHTNHDTYLSLFAKLTTDSFDDWYYPTHGLLVSGSYSWHPYALRAKSINLHRIGGEVSAAIPLPHNFTIQCTAQGFANMGDVIPGAYSNLVGGVMEGRYQDWQIAFPSLGVNMIADDVLAVGRVDLRYCLAPRHFVSAILNVGTDASSIRHLFGDKSHNYKGIVLEYAWNSMAGPMKVGVGWNDLTRRPTAYFSLGKNF